MTTAHQEPKVVESSLFHNKNFKLHWASSAISQIGTFFTLVAFPWLVLYIADNDPFIMSSVMALLTLPQGFFVLFGGPLADRLSPLKVLLVCRSIMFLSILALVMLVNNAMIHLGMLCIFAFTFGILNGFSIPAVQSLLPNFVQGHLLGKANGIVIVTMQIAQMIGPILAGWVIWFGREQLSGSVGQGEYIGLSLAFFVNALMILSALIVMSLIRIKARPQEHTQNLWFMFLQGLQFCWHDRAIRVILTYLIFISFWVHGPLMSCLPIFTKVHLGLTEKAYGVMYTMIGSGTLLGASIAYMKSFDNRQMGIVVLCCDLISGIALFLLGYQNALSSSGVLLFIFGLCGGIIMVAGTTWFQRRTPGVLMGRVMSVLMFTIVGLIPISSLISGYFIKLYSVNLVMNCAGAIMFILAVLGLSIPYIRNMGLLPRGDFVG